MIIAAAQQLGNINGKTALRAMLLSDEIRGLLVLFVCLFVSYLIFFFGFFFVHSAQIKNTTETANTKQSQQNLTQK